jgi:hypothetical protein
VGPRGAASVLSLVNANGEFIGPVVNTFVDTILEVQSLGRIRNATRVVLDVDGWPALVDVTGGWWLGNRDSLFFQSTNCTGQVYVYGSSIDNLTVPLTVTAGPPGSQVPYVADNNASPVSLVTRSWAYGPQQVCITRDDSMSGPYPVVATLPLSTLGPAPYRVVRTP